MEGYNQGEAVREGETLENREGIRSNSGRRLCLEVQVGGGREKEYFKDEEATE